MDIAPSFNHPNYTLVNNDRITRNATSKRFSMAEEEEVIKEIGRYVEAKIVSDYGFVYVSIPNDEADLKTSILASPDWTTSTKMLLIIQNSSGSMLGVFSRSMCFEEGLSRGSALPYIERAIAAGYAVIILRPNTNSVIEEIEGEKPKKIPIQGSESPEIHALCVWENIVSKCENLIHIALFGYANGSSLCKDIYLREIINCSNNNISNRIHAFITIEASHIIEIDDTLDIKNELYKIAINLESNNSLIGYNLKYRFNKLGCISISLGGLTSTSTTNNYNSAISLTLGIDFVFQYLEISENVLNVSETFVTTIANKYGYNPNHAIVTINPNPIETNDETDSSLPVSSDQTTSNSTKSGNLSPKPRPKTLLKRISGLFGSKAETEEMNDTTEEVNVKLTVQDFDLLKMVGKGAFGKVNICLLY